MTGQIMFDPNYKPWSDITGPGGIDPSLRGSAGGNMLSEIAPRSIIIEGPGGIAPWYRDPSIPDPNVSDAAPSPYMPVNNVGNVATQASTNDVVNTLNGLANTILSALGGAGVFGDQAQSAALGTQQYQQSNMQLILLIAGAAVLILLLKK